MNRRATALLVLACLAAPACEKVDQAFEAVDKAKAIKSEVEKKAQGLKKDVEQIVGGASKESDTRPDQKRERSGEREED